MGRWRRRRCGAEGDDRRAEGAEGCVAGTEAAGAVVEAGAGAQLDVRGEERSETEERECPGRKRRGARGRSIEDESESAMVFRASDQPQKKSELLIFGSVRT